MISHTMEMMLAALSVIWGGVVDRHPKLRVGFLESDGGWIAPWLDRMDRHFDDKGVQRNRAKDARERAVRAELLDLLRAGGEQHRRSGGLHWSAQYHVGDRLPHQDGFFPDAPKMMRDRLGSLSTEAAHQVTAGGALGFYGMN